MREVIRKWFWAWEFDKEEKWLNEMAAQGKALISVGYCKYEFEKTAPGEYAIRLEMLENSPTSTEGQRYISFVEETGAEYVGRVLKWVYFRKKKEMGEFELHGDNATRIKHLRRIITLLLPLGILNLFIGLYNLCIGLGVGSPINVLCSMANLGVAWLLIFGLKKLNEKKTLLEKESQLFE